MRGISMGIKNLQTGKIDTNKQYSVARKSLKGFIKGAGTGLGVAGAINTAFPALSHCKTLHHWSMRTSAVILSLSEKFLPVF